MVNILSHNDQSRACADQRCRKQSRARGAATLEKHGQKFPFIYTPRTFARLAPFLVLRGNHAKITWVSSRTQFCDFIFSKLSITKRLLRRRCFSFAGNFSVAMAITFDNSITANLIDSLSTFI